MHWVDRGPEPGGLEKVRSQFTQEWVDYCQDRTGSRPTPRWRQFHEDLSRAFSGLCGYCEEYTDGDIDHFRPRSKFPSLVYEWGNWILACQYCNRTKSSKWPDEGYIDPCTSVESERPENFFGFNTSTREIVPEEGLPSGAFHKARQMINDLDLNAPHHINLRADRIFFVEHHLNTFTEDSEEEQEFLEKITARSSALSSITRKLLEERGFGIED